MQHILVNVQIKASWTLLVSFYLVWWVASWIFNVTIRHCNHLSTHLKVFYLERFKLYDLKPTKNYLLEIVPHIIGLKYICYTRLYWLHLTYFISSHGCLVCSLYVAPLNCFELNSVMYKMPYVVKFNVYLIFLTTLC